MSGMSSTCHPERSEAKPPSPRHPERSEAKPSEVEGSKRPGGGPSTSLAGIRSAQNDDKTTKIKLCGMFREEDLEAAAELEPDYVGFIVNYPKSHRNVTPQRLVELLQAVPLPSSIKKVGVFVDQRADIVESTVKNAGLDCVQLHGSEREEYIGYLRRICPQGTQFIQTYRVSAAVDVWRSGFSKADLILLDSGRGSGKPFDWSYAQDVGRPFVLAGGLTPENVAEAISQTHPFAVDMSSGIETGKMKDPVKMAAAVKAVRNA